ncbi:MAG: hypothetical protein RMM58_12875 [Chloroflexota bacterium]|nr:hypothetical protein [Dehalococcoidia bacterium]MDW8254763.1 hypothetical protein [Chloroflexota bacterium]
MIARLRRLPLSRLEAVLLALVAAALVLDLVLFAGYSFTEDQRDRVQRQTLAVEASLATMRRPDDLEALKREIAELETQFATNPSIFPKEIDHLGINALIALAANQTGVEVAKRETGAQGVERFGNNEYRSVRYSVVARGDLRQLMVFLNRLETSQYTTLVINGQSAIFQNNIWTLQIEMTAYAQKE